MRGHRRGVPTASAMSPSPPAPPARLSLKGLHGDVLAHDAPGGQMRQAQGLTQGDHELGPSTGDHTGGDQSRPQHVGNFSGTGMAFTGAQKCANPGVKEVL